ncbi:MAG: hypothetical protein ACRY3E_01130, partial [Candidatus Lariskella arthropodorum]
DAYCIYHVFLHRQVDYKIDILLLLLPYMISLKITIIHNNQHIEYMTIIAFNVILDPIVTSSNVMANSAMCIIFERVWLIFETKGGLLNLYKAQDEA